MIWGFLDQASTDTVQITFGGGVYAATVGPDQADGKNTTWRVLLPPTTASFDKHNISITSASGSLITLTGVMFGEAWVCAGQSNMVYPLAFNATCWDPSNINCTDPTTDQCQFGCVENAGKEIAAMHEYDGGIRLFEAGFNGFDQHTPQPEMAFGSWKTPSDSNGAFSSMCWFFGRDMYAALSPKVPIGLIGTYVSGTPDEHWSSPDALAGCKGNGNSWDWPDNFTDSVLWNAQVVPLLRTVITGAIWMQGEQNTADDGRRYRCSFPSLISDWRSKWNHYTDGAVAADFPFGWAQLNSVNAVDKYQLTRFDPTCGGECAGEMDEWRSGFQSVRLAQASTLLLPNTFMAVILDTPVMSGSIHSPFKQTPGQRLARGAMSVAYGRKELSAVDPVVTGALIAPDGGSINITIGRASSGLNVSLGREGFEVLGDCPTWAQPPGLCWVPCNISAASLTTITIGKVPVEPKAVRYLWYNSPCGSNAPYHCPVYANVAPLGSLSGEDKPLPLGPFVMKLY